MDDDDSTVEQHGKDYERRQGLESDWLDLELDKALARYAAIEPRMGWKIASWRICRQRSCAASPMVAVTAVAAAVLLVALTFLWRSGEDVRTETMSAILLCARNPRQILVTEPRWQHSRKRPEPSLASRCPSKSPEQTSRRPCGFPGRSWISFLRRA